MCAQAVGAFKALEAPSYAALVHFSLVQAQYLLFFTLVYQRESPLFRPASRLLLVDSEQLLLNS